MTQTASPQLSVKANASNDKPHSSKSSKSRREECDPKTLEHSLDQKVERSEEALDLLIDEIICTGEKVVGGVQDALDDLMGYDTEYAQFLLQRDEEERKRQAEIEKIKRSETPLQRQQRLAREARMSKRKQVRNELYRDDRSPIDKLKDAIKSITFRKVCKKLEVYGLLMQPWQACTLVSLFVVMMMTNLSVMGKGMEIQAAPNSYTAFCTHCDNKYEIKRSLFEEYSFYDVHPKDFKLQYKKNQPDYPSCPKCEIVHQKLILVSRQDRDERFLLATNPFYKMPIDQKGFEELCNKYQ
ncbi:MAG TPA: hypothetical protein DCM28_10975 [Phycisphaerales bacterium]|nr:hypothetical protein [Phycisphaerales bacterium]HCD33121.1 hypothetical protein [Phycisphaerales bacterium]|tara:strand:+ start:350 stop:1243 length:894 start_codon:yes stop_codon:yes gene_type:complete